MRSGPGQMHLEIVLRVNGHDEEAKEQKAIRSFMGVGRLNETNRDLRRILRRTASGVHKYSLRQARLRLHPNLIDFSHSTVHHERRRIFDATSMSWSHPRGAGPHRMMTRRQLDKGVGPRGLQKDHEILWGSCVLVGGIFQIRLPCDQARGMSKPTT
jgi:hypothetical protein